MAWNNIHLADDTSSVLRTNAPQTVLDENREDRSERVSVVAHFEHASEKKSILTYSRYLSGEVEASLVRMDSSEELTCAPSIYHSLDYPICGRADEMREDAFKLR